MNTDDGPSWTDCERLWEAAQAYAASHGRKDPAKPTTTKIRPPAEEDGFPAPRDTSSSAAWTRAPQNIGREQHGAQLGFIGHAAREAIARHRRHKPQPKPAAVNEFILDTVGEEFPPPVFYPPLSATSLGASNSAKERKHPLAQPPEGTAKRRKRHTTRDDTHPVRRNEAKASLEIPGVNKESTALNSHDLTKTSSQSAKAGSTGRRPLPEYPGHKPQPSPRTDQESIARPVDNAIFLQELLQLYSSNASQLPGRTGQSSRALTNSLSAAARLPLATARAPFRSSGALSPSRDAHPGDGPIAPFDSHYLARKRKRQKRQSGPRGGVSAPGARGPGASRFRKIRKQDGNDEYWEQDDYAGEGGEE